MIKLDSYTPSIVRFIKSNGLAAIYVFAIDGHAPTKVGHCLNLRHRHGLVQEAHPEPITIEFLTWCPSVATAALIAEDIRHKLGISKGRAGWHNIEPAAAIETVRKACMQFPSRGMLEHTAFIAQAAAAGFTVTVPVGA